MISVERIEVDVANRGHYTNCYLIYDESKKAILIDPGYDAKQIIEYINKLEIKVEYIVITHAHGDHIGALEEIQKYTKAKIIVHKNDFDALMSKEENYSEMLGVEKQNLNSNDIISVENGYTFKVESLDFEIIHTPGHTSGSICIYEKTEEKLFTGDTIFAEGYGRCDLLSSNFDDMVNSIRMLFKRFDEDVNIYPGHDRIARIFTAERFIRMLMARKGIIL